jgi:hypothetical protein
VTVSFDTNISRPWFGPLSLAQPEVLEVLESIPSFEALSNRGMQPDKTLLYIPGHGDDGDADFIFVLGQMFAWDESSPVIWLFSTVGLCTLEQPTREQRAAFRHFELVLPSFPSNGPDHEDPFPARIGVVLSAEGATLPGWDWSQVEHPPLVQWLALVGQDFASSIKGGDQFAIPDTLAAGPGNASWTRSVLDHAVLLPVSVHMLLTGFGPFNLPTDPDDAVAPGEWRMSPGTDRFSYGNYWLLPISEAEHRKAETEGTWNMFAELVEMAPKEADDNCVVAFDLLRGSREASR